MDEYACAILIDRGRVLLGLRAPHRNTYANHWDVIGGKIEGSETAEIALQRELREELGIEVDSFQKLSSLIDKALSPAPVYHFFIVRRWRGTPVLKNHEHTELRWFAPDELDSKTLRLPEYLNLIDCALSA